MESNEVVIDHRIKINACQTGDAIDAGKKCANALMDNFPEPSTASTLNDARRVLYATQASVSEVEAKIEAAEARLAQVVRESRLLIDELECQRDALIRLLTTQHSSPERIRLWLERSGETVPLDIEIYLQVTNPNSESKSPRRRQRRSPSRSPSPPLWPLPFPHHQATTTPHYFLPPPSIIPVHPAFVPHFPPLLIPPSPPPNDDPSRLLRSGIHWGPIVFFYLCEQMHRWERFIFRFDKEFRSMKYLKSINSDAPLLQEFEVSCAEPAFYRDWEWLPTALRNAKLALPKLKKLSLQFAPFKWSSPMLRNLHTLNLRALPTAQLPIDRILHIVSNNPFLQSLTLHFQSALPVVLPLSPTTLPHVKTFHISGHYTLSSLIDVLILPILSNLALDIDAREPIEDTLTALLTRSAQPPLTHLAIGYDASASTPPFYYGTSSVAIAWGMLLPELPYLESLHVGGTQLEPLIAALRDDQPWACPDLEFLRMRHCHGHTDCVMKLEKPGIGSWSGNGGSSAGEEA
ncbi:hypothetical protein C0991_011289 [Blastosporella zonata]|nr:hypothetical protein C0991_011289 [Blastosporella zonata]